MTKEYDNPEEENEVELQPELRDVMDSLARFNAVNNNRTSFVGAFLAYDKEGDPKCESCLTIAFGFKEELVLLMDKLDEEIEENTDEDDFVNI